MRIQGEGRRFGVWAVFLALLLLVAAVGVGCGGDDEAADTGTQADGAADDAGGTLKIGHLSNCEGPFAPFYDETTGGAMLPLIQRGAEPAGARGSDGVENANVAGLDVEIVWGCSDSSPDSAIAEARRLVEREQVDILLGPLSGSEGIAIANYSEEHPDVTFVNGISGAQDATLKVRSENFFRWHNDGAQWTAGLGDYAYNELGWRTAVTIGDDYDFPYTQIAGFVAEFCALGGQIPTRLWPPLGSEDYSSFIAQIPEGVDGFFLGVGGSGVLAFVRQYEQLRGNLSDRILGGIFMTDPVIHQELGERIVGVVTAGMTAGDSDEPAYQEYTQALADAYPDLEGTGASVFTYGYYTAMEAILQTLEAVEGDLGEGHEDFRNAMAELTLGAPLGEIRLDENRQAIMDNFLQQIVEDQTGDGVPDVQTISRIPEVDQTFAGFFSPETPSPDRDNPDCNNDAEPPPWTEQGGGR